jgi:hypothetical protein
MGVALTIQQSCGEMYEESYVDELGIVPGETTLSVPRQDDAILRTKLVTD